MDNFGNEVVIKIPRYDIPNPKVAEDKLNVEIDILRTLWSAGGHRNIVKYISDCKLNTIPILVEEFVRGSTLEQEINQRGSINQSEAINCCLKLLSAVSFLHSHNVINRDLSPDNIMLRNNNISEPVIIDLGTAKKGYTQISLGTRIYGKPFIAPEVQSGGYCFNSDLYSIAAILLAMLAGTTKIERFFKASSKGPILRDDIARLVKCDIWLSDILKSVLDPDPHNRLFRTADEMINALTKVSVKPILKGQAVLIVLGKRYFLDEKSTYTIGRDSSCDIHIPDPIPYISRHHATIFYDASKRSWMIRDNSSLNGTVVDRQGTIHVVFTGRAHGSQGLGIIELKNGDKIGLAWRPDKGAYFQLEFMEA